MRTFKKSGFYALIALILLVIGFVLPSVAFYKVPQKIAAGQTESIPAYVYPLWDLYQTGRYVSPYTPKGAEHNLRKMIEKKGEIGMMSLPIWYVALEAPNYPKAAFPEGIPVWFHIDGFSGDIHEMNTINHYVGMYPLEAGACRRSIHYVGHCVADCAFYRLQNTMECMVDDAISAFPSRIFRLLCRVDVLVRAQHAGLGGFQN